jgi:hypothetical protein
LVLKEDPDKRLYIVLDNLNRHTNEAAKNQLKANRFVSFHFTPTHGSWVNLIEGFFSILTRQVSSKRVTSQETPLPAPHL